MMCLPGSAAASALQTREGTGEEQQSYGEQKCPRACVMLLVKVMAPSNRQSGLYQQVVSYQWTYSRGWERDGFIGEIGHSAGLAS